ncbi:MAG: phosphonate ABC transporter, permease protein PhnE [Roseibium sp.]|uniref:phosphonate ABC transporter, permease protein PhnE n=1 Tax=Roseibium sp. TaxID=1936156 RepID=UPI001B21C75A|nr:phosphonate ABC transporter, permease protein PhnE [Roseibium sp.]MBO6510261.1 phosphonate ABC transporter, permease protein PhnE [Roseibium sp.]MBO6892635.1 phosphonate ABC transporter, permease protein PhnE [Roseibium sp.]MBO6928235.1 phosphonate ABC transporter, permease protein PhnE [Roseibium sp.]
MSTELDAVLGQRWKKPPLIKRRWLRWTIGIGSLAYLVAAFMTIDVNWARVYEGLDRGAAFILAFTSPDFVSRASDIWEGLLESIIMTVAASVVGIAISIPIGLGAARNIAPLPIYLICRGIVAISRALQEIIVAILLVAIFGFGPLAGFLTLSFATIGFLSKLLAEDIESMDKVQAEAIKASGARWLQWINYGVQPQVMPRLVGLSMYRVDINFRESAILGLVGAGGIGATLNTAFDRYEYDTAAAILILIILIVMSLEYLSGIIRARVQ